MAFRYNKTLLLIKSETTYGTDPTPAEDADEVVASVPELGINTTLLQRTLATQHFGGVAGITQGDSITIGCETEIIASGAAGTAPKIGKLFKACNMTETVNSGTSVVYTNNSLMGGSAGSSGAASVTIYFYRDAMLHKALGCRGTWKLTANAGETVKIRWDFTGLYGGTAIVAGTFPTTPTYDTGSPLTFESLSTVEWNDTSRILSSWTYDQGNTISKRTSAASADGIAEYLITDRRSKATYEFEAVALGTWNPYTELNANTLGKLDLAWSGSAGYGLTVLVGQNQITKYSQSDRNGYVTYNLDCDALPTAATGNDEISLTFV